jgi:hypothetical protein
MPDSGVSNYGDLSYFLNHDPNIELAQTELNQELEVAAVDTLRSFHQSLLTSHLSSFG